jgi:CheY-like chemotaxis protein
MRRQKHARPVYWTGINPAVLIRAFFRFLFSYLLMMPGIKKILIVDDSAEDVYLLQHALLECGIGEVQSLNSGGDAAKYVAGLPPFQFREIPDLIFIDINMQGIDGLALIQWLQRNPIFKKIPMVVLSGSEDPEQKTKAMEMGAAAFYSKPQQNNELINVVEKVLKDCFGANFVKR